MTDEPLPPYRPPTWDERRRRIREQAITDVLVLGMTPLASAVTWGVLTAEVERWVEEEFADRAARAERGDEPRSSSALPP
ncbi:MAG: hypothetical protein ACRDQ0_01260 [Pseudonocardia sp.]